MLKSSTIIQKKNTLKKPHSNSKVKNVYNCLLYNHTSTCTCTLDSTKCIQNKCIVQKNDNKKMKTFLDRNSFFFKLKKNKNFLYTLLYYCFSKLKRLKTMKVFFCAFYIGFHSNDCHSNFLFQFFLYSLFFIPFVLTICLRPLMRLLSIFMFMNKSLFSK